MKRTIKRTLILLALAVVFLTGCAQANAETAAEPFAEVADMAAPAVDEPDGIRCTGALESGELETCYESDYGWVESYTPSYSGDGFQQEGVRYHDGRTETYYSSNVLYHYRTGEWTVDDEGYYRDSDGYYVVAASDIAEGETLETSKGTAKVYDDGCDAGVTDFYTNF